MKKHIKGIILFFVIYLWIHALISPFKDEAKADELNCETFVKEELCNMTDQEQEEWFWKLFKSLIQDREAIETIET